MQRQHIYRQIGLFSGTVLLGLSLNAVSGHADQLTETTVTPETTISAKEGLPSESNAEVSSEGPQQTPAPSSSSSDTEVIKASKQTTPAADRPATASSVAVSKDSASRIKARASTPVIGTTSRQPAVTVRRNVVRAVKRLTQTTPVRTSARESTENGSHVTPQNFLDYFGLNGAATYDAQTGIVTLTPDAHNQVGNFSLKSKIAMQNSFSLRGEVNLGSDPNGADGIGFAFHNGNVTDVGNAGGNLGVGGLIAALGFKLDTWHNDAAMPETNLPGAQIASTDSNGFGWAADPAGKRFGGFVTTTLKDVQMANQDFVDRWWAETDKASVQDLAASALDGQFHKFDVTYDGDTRVLTITYQQNAQSTLTWQRVVPATDEALAMIVSASTGGAKNLQQFKLTSFDYQQAATVNVAYVDLNGHRIDSAVVGYPDGAVVGGNYTTEQLEIPGYRFVKMDDTGDVSGQMSLKPNGVLSRSGDNGTVVYVYAPAYQVSQRVVHETIRYVDEQGKSVAPTSCNHAVTFVTVTDPTSGDKRIFYAQGVQAKPQLADDGVPVNQAGVSWTAGVEAEFTAVDHPVVAGYRVIANSAADNDLVRVTPQKVFNDAADLAFTVVYAPTADPEKPVEPEKPVDPQKPVDPVSPEQPIGPDEPGDPNEPNEPDKPASSVHVDRPQTPTTSDTGEPTTPLTRRSPSTATREQPRGATVSLPYSRYTWTQPTQQLPQTNEHTTTWLRDVGVGLLAVLGYLGYGFWRRH
ncbi:MULTISPECIES: MucBP domain-containing protein [Lactobacillaceae]|uniref:lectin-like domain-containing protein n=1 Tax=Lactobacillaceae TaxID=33958 RepID=UPI0014567444|nr:MucBP domain-containing protein [Lactobacillus sp. HBUAS51381]NLR10340.1 hypothetical protein [Lactobacillus sp. HBUAS51381]